MKTKKTNTATSSAAMNKLRAAVLGANDGIVSTSSVVMGVAGATSNKAIIFTAGIAALVAGALSMAVGEYVSVSSQSDAEKAYIDQERKLLRDNPAAALKQLEQSYANRGVSPATAATVARELSDKDALQAHLEAEFTRGEDDISSPVQAAIASLVAFSIGGVIPFLAIIIFPTHVNIWATVLAVVIALTITGYLSARAGNAVKSRAIGRVIIGGMAAMGITYLVGSLFGMSYGA